MAGVLAMVKLEKGVTLITGNYGSGKTEVAVNLARILAGAGTEVTLADLDIRNPYFRSRKAAAGLEAAGVRVIIPREGYFFADLPIIVPEIRGALRMRDRVFIGDVGGDDTGARILGSFSDLLAEGTYVLLMVINANRPFTDTAEGCRKMISEIEASSRLMVTGLVANTHLMEETTPDIVRRGYRLAVEVAESKGIQVTFVAAPAALEREFDADPFRDRLIAVERTMLPPWKRGGSAAAAGARN